MRICTIWNWIEVAKNAWSEKNWPVFVDRQSTKLCFDILGERTAACLEKYYPRSKTKLALAKFIRCVSDCHKIGTSRTIYDNSDELRSAFGVHYEVHTFPILEFWNIFFKN